MRTIAHLSDLHFGTEDPAVAAALERELIERRPALVVVSGDVTQRARRAQFRAARDYLRRLPFPQLVVPGNHDIPLFDVLRRFLSPLGRYRKLLTADLAPCFLDDELAVFGVNTARSLTWKKGRIALDQIDGLRTRLSAVPQSVFRIVVTHHPFIPPPGSAGAGIDLVGRAAAALEVLDACAADLLLAGHLHHGYSGDVRAFYPAARRSIVVAQAGTAISRRLRDTPNAYNWITLGGSTIEIRIREWQGTVFCDRAMTPYELRAGEWRSSA